jgi:hypothetical protein
MHMLFQPLCVPACMHAVLKLVIINNFHVLDLYLKLLSTCSVLNF